MADGNSISLYFDLKPGEKADLEIVAEAALKWAETVKLAARLIEPNAKIRIELLDAEPGSLRLNTVLDWLEEQLERIETGSGRHRRLRNLAIALAAFVASATATELIFGNETLQLEDADRQLLQELLEKIGEAPEVQDNTRRFYRVLERDSSITAIGVSESRKDPPLILVPSDQFPERGGLFALQEDEDERVIYSTLEVTLVSPVLLNTPRAWTFRMEGLPEFTAIMGDANFLAALDDAHVHESLRNGITMKIKLEIKEQKVRGEWKVKSKGRKVLKVISPEIG
ncbi:MAG: hypothetical protein RIC29_03400 [Rhodospirillaceae bacterium]